MTATKPPTINQLISFQKQQAIKLSSEQKFGTHLPKMDKFKQVMMNQDASEEEQDLFQKVSWEDINDRIDAAKQQVAYIEQQPSQYLNIQSEYKAHKLRNQINKNKFKKTKLSQEKNKLEKSATFELQKLDSMISYLQQLEKQIKSKGYGQFEMGNNESAKQYKNYPNVSSIIEGVSPQIKQQFISKVRNNNFINQPIELLNILSIKTLQSDQNVSFLQEKKQQEQEKIENLERQWRLINNNQFLKIKNLEVLKKQEQNNQQQLQRLNQQIAYVQRGQYVIQQIAQRIKTQKDIYDKQGQKMRIMILKLCRLVQLSGNEEALERVNQILKQNRIQR